MTGACRRRRGTHGGFEWTESIHLGNGPHGGRRLNEELHTGVDLERASSAALGGSMASGAQQRGAEQRITEMGNRTRKKISHLGGARW
jgi:hypothetical protein